MFIRVDFTAAVKSVFRIDQMVLSYRAALGSAVEEAGRWVRWAGKVVPGLGGSEVERVVVREIQEMLPQYGRGFVRLAGLSGAVAVGLGAYGAHGE